MKQVSFMANRIDKTWSDEEIIIYYDGYKKIRSQNFSPIKIAEAIYRKEDERARGY